MFDLNGKTALVTGASGGIGQALVEELCAGEPGSSSRAARATRSARWPSAIRAR